MKQLLKLAAAPAVGLLALALTRITTPAAGAKYDIDAPTSRLRCEAAALPRWGKAMSAGRGGTCARDPFLPAASDAYAYQPKGGLHRVRKLFQYCGPDAGTFSARLKRPRLIGKSLLFFPERQQAL